MEILGYLGALIIGITLGLLGGGGSILTVPILVYFFKVDAVMATAYSLFIVGCSSLIGSINYWRKGLVRLKTAIYFGVPSVVMVFVTRKWIVPAFPDGQWVSIGSWGLTKDIFILTLFALMMILSSYFMIKGKKKPLKENVTGVRNPLFGVIVEGVVVGFLTGLVGAGGGFIIVPALILLFGLNMKEAVGTSLFIITVKSLVGFIGDATNDYTIDYSLLLGISALAVLGILLGATVSNKVPGPKLKKVFGWMVLIMGLSMLGGELLAPLFY